MLDQRSLFEAAVVDRMKESGFLEVEIRTECLVRCDQGYLDEVINAGWHYWQAGRASREIGPAAMGDADEPFYGMNTSIVEDRDWEVEDDHG